MRTLIYTFFTFVLILYGCETETKNVTEKDVKLAPGINMPVPEGAYDVNPYHSSKYKRATSYKIKIDYPADSVIIYYNRELAGLGLKELSVDPLNGSPVDNYTWTEGSRDSKRSRQFMKYWTNDDESLLFILILRYDTNLLDKWDDVLTGECQILDYNVQKTIMGFFNKLTEDGKDIEFFQLQAKYMNKDGEFDIDKAIKDNPDKHYLQEYRDIMDRLSNQE